VKSLFVSKTFLGAIFALIIAVAPAAKAIAKGEGELVDHIVFIVLSVAACGQTIVGRVTATGGVYTPKGLWGPDRPEEAEIEPFEP
jgi:hypothetical protein